MTAPNSESRQSPSSPAPISTATLALWLEEHPEALVGALDSVGRPLDVPASVPLSAGHHRDSRSLLELVIPEDASSVVDAFTESVRRGAGSAKIHMLSDPERPLLLQYLDLRDQHDVVLRFVVPSEELDLERRRSLQPEDFSSRPRVGVMTKDEMASICSIDEAASFILGWDESEMVGRSTLDFIHPDDQVRAIDNWMSRLVQAQDHVRTVRLRYRCKDGDWLWLETSNDFRTEEDGSTIVVTQLIDVSAEMAATEALRRSESFLRSVTETVPVGLFHVTAEGEVAFVNPVLERLLGRAGICDRGELEETLAGTQKAMVSSAVERVLCTGREEDLEIALPSRTPEKRPICRVTLGPVLDGEQVEGVLGCVVDVTDLRSLANTDALTGLHNRRSILELLSTAVDDARGRISALFIDLDAFKDINDRFGHGSGDKLLGAVAGRLRAALRPTDTIGRIGGDEFLAVCPRARTAQEAETIAIRLRHSLAAPFEVCGQLLSISASIGVASGEPGVGAEQLVSMADEAMYGAKATGQGVNVFSPAHSGEPVPTSER
ncbi:MAG: diguanylate cyclase domain-containing protein [Acidimicrobiales bacterium]